MHGFNTQTTEGDYRIQFQTDSRDEWLLVQQLCRDIMDGKKLSQPQRWIPVTEKPPKEDVEVLVYLFDPPSPYIAWVSKFDGKWHTEDFTLDEEDIPIAYMPMPEPYKERQG